MRMRTAFLIWWHRRDASEGSVTLSLSVRSRVLMTKMSKGPLNLFFFICADRILTPSNRTACPEEEIAPQPSKVLSKLTLLLLRFHRSSYHYSTNRRYKNTFHNKRWILTTNFWQITNFFLLRAHICIHERNSHSTHTAKAQQTCPVLLEKYGRSTNLAEHL